MPVKSFGLTVQSGSPRLIAVAAIKASNAREEVWRPAPRRYSEAMKAMRRRRRTPRSASVAERIVAAVTGSSLVGRYGAAVTYLLIHGGGSTARFWDRLVPLLDGPALAVNLPGRADKPSDLATQTVDAEVASVVADVLVVAPGDPLVVVAHSSGGLVVPGVVAGLAPSGIVVERIVLNAALVPEEGGRGLDCMKPHHRDGLQWAVDEAVENGEPMIVLGVPDDRDQFRAAYGGDPLTDDDLEFAIDPVRCVPDTVNHYFQPVHWSQAAGIPVTYVLNERDRPVSPDNQDVMAARIADLQGVVRLPGGHCPAITDPQGLVAALSA